METVQRLNEYMVFRGLSEQTINRWTKAVEQFCRFCKKDGNFTKDDVIRYISAMRATKMKGSYMRFLFYVLKLFYKANNYDWNFDKGDIPKSHEDEYTPIFTVREVDRMLEVAKRKGIKFYAIMRLSKVTGVRRIEVKNLNRNDFKPPKLKVKTAKHGKPVSRELDLETIRAIQEYLDKRKGKAKKHPALFLSSHRNPRRYSLSGLSYLIRTIREEAGIKKPGAGFHGDRRLFVTTAHTSGIMKEEITKYMGWKRKDTVDKYIILSPKDVSKKVKKVHPFLRD